MDLPQTTWTFTAGSICTVYTLLGELNFTYFPFNFVVTLLKFVYQNLIIGRCVWRLLNSSNMDSSFCCQPSRPRWLMSMLFRWLKQSARVLASHYTQQSLYKQHDHNLWSQNKSGYRVVFFLGGKCATEEIYWHCKSIYFRLCGYCATLSSVILTHARKIMEVKRVKRADWRHTKLTRTYAANLWLSLLHFTYAK